MMDFLFYLAFNTRRALFFVIMADSRDLKMQPACWNEANA